MNQNIKTIGIYVHIPFCVRKCNYCDFLSFANMEEYYEMYCGALKKQIKASSKLLKETYVETIFIGGGTPSILDEKYISDIINLIKFEFKVSPNAEITIECNPGTLNEEKANSYIECGINRISFGLQTTDDKELKCIGRIHTFSDFEKSYRIARNAGFKNINIDVMSALPGQTLQNYKEGLEKIISFNPEHISAYSLIIEEGTHLYNNLEEYPACPDEDTEREMYYETKNILHKYGYERYEISNYSKKGYECKHNLSYWECKDYLGVGLGAASLINDVRMCNEKNLTKYIEYYKNYDYTNCNYTNCNYTNCDYVNCDYTNCDYVNCNYTNCDYRNYDYTKYNCDKIMATFIEMASEYEKLTIDEKMSEFMFLGLRKCIGVSDNEFQRKFNKKITDVYGNEIKNNIKKDLLKSYISESGEKMYCLTETGIDLSNMVMSDFV